MNNSSDDTCRILLCEDSLTFVQGLTDFLERDPELRVVAHCLTGEEAAGRLAKTEPDLVIMDIALPGIDGVEATRRIKATRPVPVLVLSAHTRRGSQVALAALGAGAIDVRSKEDVTFRHPTGARAVAFRRYVKRLARLGVAGGRDIRGPATNAAASEQSRSISVICVAASAGGPPALRAVLQSLPADFPVPIMVVQQIAAGFLDPLIEWLDGQVALPVRPARDATALSPGVWIAPDGAHLLIEEGPVTTLDTEVVPGYQQPAADFLFVSAASTVGAGSVAIVLTAMDKDAADGIAAVRRCGGLTIAQDDTAAVVDGLPAAAHVDAELVLPLADIGPALSRLSPAGP